MLANIASYVNPLWGMQTQTSEQRNEAGVKKIIEDLESFTDSLNENLNEVHCTDEGEWTIQQATCCSPSQRLKTLAKAVIHDLDCFEQNQYLHKSGHNYLKVAKMVINILSENGMYRAVDVLADLQRKYTAFKHRLEDPMEEEIARLNPINFNNDLKDLHNLANDWKLKQKNLKQKELSLEQLKEVAYYDDFVELLIGDSKLRNKFFRWTMKYNCSISAFVKFPYLSDKIIPLKRLMERISSYNGKFLKVEDKTDNGVRYKDLTLQFEEHGRQSLLKTDYRISMNREVYNDGKGQTVLENWSIREILKDFADKDLRIGAFEIFDSGVKRWNSHELAIQVNFANEKWLEELPVILKLNRDDLMTRYTNGITPNDLQRRVVEKKLNEGSWIIAAACYYVDEKEKMGFGFAHAWLELAVPENGVYKIYPFGVYAKNFPQNLWQKFHFSAETHEGTWQYPDACSFNEFPHFYLPFIITPQKGKNFIDLLKGDLLNDQMVYQFVISNCAFHALRGISSCVEDKRIPKRLFKVHYNDLDPKNKVFHFSKKYFLSSPYFSWMHGFLLTSVHRLMGLASPHIQLEKEEKIYSLFGNEPWNKIDEMCHPGTFVYFLKLEELCADLFTTHLVKSSL